MSYAPVPIAEDIELDLEARPSLSASPRARSRALQPLHRKVLAVFKRKDPKIILGGLLAGSLLLGYPVYQHAEDLVFDIPGYLQPDVYLPGSGYRQQQLDFIPTDGVLTPPHRETLIANWPEDYPRQASFQARNLVIRDTQDPWPDKPYIASVWLSPNRFPEGLEGLPHDDTWLPEIGSETGAVLPPGLHDPPLPSFPNITLPHVSMNRVPREDIYQTPRWRPPVRGMGKPRRTRAVQANGRQTKELGKINDERRSWVRRAFLHAWEGYKSHAFGHDETTPLSRKHRDSYNFWGASLVDNLDTLLILGLTHEYNVARTHVRSLDFTFLASPEGCGGRDTPVVHVFETVIRYLGGLLSAYDLSGDELMLARAVELGDLLLPAFGTRHGFPVPMYQLGRNPMGAAISQAIGAEPGSLCMELTRLSQLTGDLAYFNAAIRIADLFATFKSPYGSLISTFLSDEGDMFGDFTIGGMVDSHYEYMIKMCQLLGDTEGVYGRLYRQAVADLYEYLIVNVTVIPDRPGVVIIGGRQRRSDLRPEQQHLSTFAGGMFGLGAKLLGRGKDLATAIALTDGAIWAYSATATGLMPEMMEFSGPKTERKWSYGSSSARLQGKVAGVLQQQAPDYRGRPEAIESVFYMYRITGDPYWSDAGWRMFTAWMSHAITPAGFANIADVNAEQPTLADHQESFVLAETLKYYYLLFSPPDLISLDDYVFNTEAHPFRLPHREHKLFWDGPDQAVDRAYADPR